MSEKDEFDRYRVPATSRFQIFKWGLSGMSATASLLLYLLLRCNDNCNGKNEELWNARINDIKSQIKTETQSQIKQVDNSLTPQINQAHSSIDSFKVELKALKN